MTICGAEICSDRSCSLCLKDLTAVTLIGGLHTAHIDTVVVLQQCGALRLTSITFISSLLRDKCNPN